MTVKYKEIYFDSWESWNLIDVIFPCSYEHYFTSWAKFSIYRSVIYNFENLNAILSAFNE